jgi:hypothetical protein
MEVPMCHGFRQKRSDGRAGLGEQFNLKARFRCRFAADDATGQSSMQFVIVARGDAGRARNHPTISSFR